MFHIKPSTHALPGWDLHRKVLGEQAFVSHLDARSLVEADCKEPAVGEQLTPFQTKAMSSGRKVETLDQMILPRLK